MIFLDVIQGHGPDLPFCQRCRQGRARWGIDGLGFTGEICNGCLIALLRELWHAAGGEPSSSGLLLEGTPR